MEFKEKNMILLTHERQWRGGETVVAFGMFDGVHEGHAQLMRKANELAALHDLKSVVYTFSSHPMATYAPEKVPPQLETRSEKVRSIARLGIDAAVLRPFDRTYAAQTPEEFVRSFVDALHPKHVVVGFNYSFGCKGAGKADDMRRFGEQYGFETHVVDEVQMGGEPVSSTRVRAAVTKGGYGAGGAADGQTLCHQRRDPQRQAAGQQARFSDGKPALSEGKSDSAQGRLCCARVCGWTVAHCCCKHRHASYGTRRTGNN